MLNRIMLIGNLTADPQGPRNAGSSKVTDFRIACSERWGPRDDQQRTLFIDVECWGRLAEVVADNLRKGRRVFVEGRLQLDEWGEGEQRRSKYKINASGVQFLDRPSDGDINNNEGQQTSSRQREEGKSRLPDYALDDTIPF